MPREIVSIQVGGCGNRIGLKFWETICNEHGVSEDGICALKDHSRMSEDALKQAEMAEFEKRDKMGVYFRHTSDDRFTARAVNTDLDPEVLDLMKVSPFSSVFAADSTICGRSSAGNNWAKGHYTDGIELMDQIMDQVRKETEYCDCIQGFQLCHSLGGGTGSGMGTRIAVKLKESYSDRIISTFSVFPSKKVSDVVVEPYSATLSINYLLDYSDQSFVIDNEALFNLSQKILKPGEIRLSWN